MTETQATVVIVELFGIFWILLGMFFNIGERRHHVSPEKAPEEKHRCPPAR